MKQKTAFKNNLAPEEIERLSTLFPKVSNFKFGEIQYGGKILICICSFLQSETLNLFWKEINNYISAEFVSLEKEEFSKWNFYMFYVCPAVEKSIQYEIENNKFCSRKIVVDKNVDVLSDDQIIEILDEHITNDNLIISIDDTQRVKLEKDPIIAETIESFKELNNKKQYGEYLENILTQLEKGYEV